MTAPRAAQAGVEQLAESLRSHGVGAPRIAFVLGSGLGAFAERIEKARSIPYEQIEAMPSTSVPGHAGRLVVGEIAGAEVVAQQGRAHLYEGWTVDEVTRAVRALARLGCTTFVMTNAAGGIRLDRPPGTLMAIRDHLNFQWRTPLGRDEAGFGCPYDAGLLRELDAAANELDIVLASGVYAGLPGPSYETPAEIAMLARFGADAVGMSTVAEVLAARASGARVAGVSLITNYAAGITGEPLSHAEVVAAGRDAAGRFSRLLERFAFRIAR
jgi:purine-nucleoside phosphorylase